MEKKELFDFINRGIDKYPKITTTVVTTTILSLLTTGYVFGNVKKPKIDIKLPKIVSTKEENKITMQELNDCYLAEFHNELTGVNNYKFVTENGNSIINVLNGEKIFDLSNNEDKIVNFSKLGGIDEYLLTYDMIDTTYNKNDLEDLLNKISDDIMENNKKLVK